jgi:mercuric reductase
MTLRDGCAPAPLSGSGAYDLAVIGAGSAGFAAAITAAESGAQVALMSMA